MLLIKIMLMIGFYFGWDKLSPTALVWLKGKFPTASDAKIGWSLRAGQFVLGASLISFLAFTAFELVLSIFVMAIFGVCEILFTLYKTRIINFFTNLKNKFFK